MKRISLKRLLVIMKGIATVIFAVAILCLNVWIMLKLPSFLGLEGWSKNFLIGFIGILGYTWLFFYALRHIMKEPRLFPHIFHASLFYL
jgi:drug/metabolite transporter (DMT)-like permease